MSTSGIVALPSPVSFSDTVTRLVSAFQDRGIRVFAVIDQQEEARAVGLCMPPTTLIVSGSPKAGTPLMLANPSIGVDLPLKALVCENEPGQVRVLFTSAATLIERFSLPPRFQDNLAAAERLIAEVLASADPAGTAPAPR